MENPTQATIAGRGFRSRRCAGASGLALLGLVSTVASAQNIDGEHAMRMERGLELFKGKVRQVLVDNCLSCHGGGQTLGGLDLSSRDALVASGKLGDPAGASALLSVLRHEREPVMPFEQAKRDRIHPQAVAPLDAARSRNGNQRQTIGPACIGRSVSVRERRRRLLAIVPEHSFTPEPP